MNKSGKIITAFALGSAAGAFLGLLLSQKGEKAGLARESEKGKLFPGTNIAEYQKNKARAKREAEDLRPTSVN